IQDRAIADYRAAQARRVDDDLASVAEALAAGQAAAGRVAECVAEAVRVGKPAGERWRRVYGWRLGDEGWPRDLILPEWTDNAEEVPPKYKYPLETESYVYGGADYGYRPPDYLLEILREYGYVDYSRILRKAVSRTPLTGWRVLYRHATDWRTGVHWASIPVQAIACSAGWMGRALGNETIAPVSYTFGALVPAEAIVGRIMHYSGGDDWLGIPRQSKVFDSPVGDVLFEVVEHEYIVDPDLVDPSLTWKCGAVRTEDWIAGTTFRIAGDVEEPLIWAKS
ncbi:hypothetical protein, partial [Gordonia sihwensis]